MSWVVNIPFLLHPRNTVFFTDRPSFHQCYLEVSCPQNWRTSDSDCLHKHPQAQPSGCCRFNCCHFTARSSIRHALSLPGWSAVNHILHIWSLFELHKLTYATSFLFSVRHYWFHFSFSSLRYERLHVLICGPVPFSAQSCETTGEKKKIKPIFCEDDPKLGSPRYRAQKVSIG